MQNLFDVIDYETFSLASGPMIGHTGLKIGTVGSGEPIGLVTAGVHGDEGPWGAWAIRKFLMETPVEDLQGTLRIVPVANPYAMEADARNAPFDTLDLNRQFPGNSNGSHTERLAALLTQHALANVDVAIDLHGGGSWCINSFAFQMPGGEDISRAFGAPFIVNAPDRSVTLTGYARTQGATVAAIEMGGRSEHEIHWADKIAKGLRRALGIAGVLRPTDEQPEMQSIPVGQTTVLRPSVGGIFIPTIRTNAIGTIVNKGTILGEVLDTYTQETIEVFEAPYDQTAILLLRPTVSLLEGGAMTYVVAEPL